MDTVAGSLGSFERRDSDPAERATRNLKAAREPGGEGARAFVSLDDDEVMRQARLSSRRVTEAAGKPLSPLEGVTISIKDNFDVAGERTTAGSAALASAPAAAEDAVAVARLRAAGAVLLGRTNMVEFAYTILGLNAQYGTPKNVWDRQAGGGRIPGGSSSGAAISVADGMCVAALGSDTGGSIRVPAALNGLCGFKPTARRIPVRGLLPLSVSLDSVGTIARSIACCATLDAVLAGEPAPLAPTPARLESVRLALPESGPWRDLDPEVEAAARRAVRALESAGARVDRIAFPELDECLSGTNPHRMLGGEFAAWHRAMAGDALLPRDPVVRHKLERAGQISKDDYFESVIYRRGWIERMEARMRGYDAIVCPTVACLPPLIAEVTQGQEAFDGWNRRVLRNVGWVNYLDGCAATLPCHLIGDAPAGLQLVAPNGSDARLLGIARACEALLEDVRRAH